MAISWTLATFVTCHSSLVFVHPFLEKPRLTYGPPTMASLLPSFIEDVVNRDARAITNAAELWRARAHQLEDAIEKVMSDIGCFHENEEEARKRKQDDVAKAKTLERQFQVEVDEARKKLEGVKKHFLNLLNNIEQKNEFAKSQVLKSEERLAEYAAILQEKKEKYLKEILFYEENVKRVRRQMELINVLSDLDNNKVENYDVEDRNGKTTPDGGTLKTINLEILRFEAKKKELLAHEEDLISVINKRLDYLQHPSTTIMGANDLQVKKLCFSNQLDYLLFYSNENVDNCESTGTAMVDIELELSYKDDNKDKKGQQKNRCSRFSDIWPLMHLDMRNKYSRVWKLSIEGHRIESLKFLTTFKHTLEYLNASRNSLRLSMHGRDGEEDNFNYVCGLYKLKVLNVSGNWIKRIPVEISKLEALEELDISGNAIGRKLEYLRMEELRKLENLYSLSCKGNEITRHEKYKSFVLKYLLHLVKLDGTFLTCFDFGAKNHDIHQTKISRSPHATLRMGNRDERVTNVTDSQAITPPPMPIPRLDTDSVLLTPVATVELDKDFDSVVQKRHDTWTRWKDRYNQSLQKSPLRHHVKSHHDEHGGNIVDEINRIVSRK